MKHWLIILLICIYAPIITAQETKGSSSAGGGDRKFGLGLTLLGPNGITGKYFMDEKLAIEGSLGFGSFGEGRFHMHGVVTYNFIQINPSLAVYGGGGLVLDERGYDNRGGNGKGRGLGNIINNLRNDRYYETSLGIRAPIGISWRNSDKRFELSGEAYLNLFFSDRNVFDLGLALAGRYYF